MDKDRRGRIHVKILIKDTIDDRGTLIKKDGTMEGWC